MTQTELDLLHFQRFGSANSQDIDIMVFVNSLDEDQNENHKVVKELNDFYEKKYYLGKKINCNLCIYNHISGTIVDVFKGTPDEVNNSLYHTYELHEQVWNNLIFNLVPRIVDYKFIRVSRFILSFFSRVPKLRPQIKAALRGTYQDRLDVLSTIKFIDYEHYDFSIKGEKNEDVWKVIAFQLGISIALEESGKEIYTKDDLVFQYPSLFTFINRMDSYSPDFLLLDRFLSKFLKLGQYIKMEFETELEYDNKYKLIYERTYL